MLSAVSSQQAGASPLASHAWRAPVGGGSIAILSRRTRAAQLCCDLEGAKALSAQPRLVIHRRSTPPALVILLRPEGSFSRGAGAFALAPSHRAGACQAC